PERALPRPVTAQPLRLLDLPGQLTFSRRGRLAATTFKVASEVIDPLVQREPIDLGESLVNLLQTGHLLQRHRVVLDRTGPEHIHVHPLHASTVISGGCFPVGCQERRLRVEVDQPGTFAHGTATTRAALLPTWFPAPSRTILLPQEAAPG